MPHPIEPSTLRILHSNGKTVGTGFLVAKNLAVTCAHVVNDAEAIEGDIIQVQFAGQDQKIEARVLPEFWSEADKFDVAVLQLNEVPAGVFPLRMGRASESRLKNDLYTFGYAFAADEQGIGGLGTFITLKQEGNFIQFRMHEANHGHSGAPIYDDQRGVVVGMIAKGHSGTGRNAETTFAIPTEIIWQVCPQLKPPTPILPHRNPIVEGINLLPYDYDQRIQNFLTEYLGTDSHPVPFGGRDDALKMLDTWLAETAPYLLLAAPAGRGKSALLVRWLDSLKAREDLALAFVPVSIRFGTNMERIFYAALAARLAFLHGDDIPASPETSTAVYRGLVSDYLSKPLANGRTLLVVLDGLDEAADWQAGADFMPNELPAGVRVVVSARFLAGDADSTSWLSRLNWKRSGLASAPSLTSLDRAGVTDVVLKMGCPLDELSRNVNIIDELYRLSEGDPLLVSLYVSDLWAKGEEVNRLKPEDLASIQPSYAGYFDRWWDDQKKLWGKEKPWLEQHVRKVRNLLAGALSSLFVDDMQALDPELVYDYVADALEVLQRFIIGDNKTLGYTFSHPKLGQHFWDAMPGGEQLQVEERFLMWCGQTLHEFIIGKRNTTQKTAVPAYVVRNYGAHLTRAQQPIEKYLALIQHQQWAQVWFTVEGAYGGYLQDVHRVWEQCKILDMRSVETIGKAPYLGQQIRCALIETSLHSLASNVSPKLLSNLVEHQIWTSSQALAYIRQVPSSNQRTQSLISIMPFLPSGYFGSIISSLNEIKSEELRGALLIELAKWLPENLFEDVFFVVNSIKSDENLKKVLIALAERMPDNLLGNVLIIARNIKDDANKASALGKLAHRLPLNQQNLVYKEALFTVQQIKSEFDRVDVLLVFTKELPDELLSTVLFILRKMTVWTRVHVYSLLIHRTPEPLLQEAISCLSDIDTHLRKSELAKLLNQIPVQTLESSLDTLNISNKKFRSEVKVEINKRTNASTAKEPPENNRDLSNEHVDETTEYRIGDEKLDDEQEKILLGKYSKDELDKILRKELSDSQIIKDKNYINYFYSSISDSMPMVFTEQLLKDAREIKDNYCQFNILHELIKKAAK